MIVLLRGLSPLFGDTSESDERRASEALDLATREREIEKEHLEEVRFRAQQLASYSTGEPAVAMLAGRLAVALRVADCVTANRRARDLMDFTPQTSPSHAEAAALAIAVFGKCGGSPSPAAGP